MALLDQILEENARFVAQLPESYLHRNEKVSKYPARQLAIYTCMDTRLVDFLEPAMGIARGEAKVIKAAGNMITGPFDEVIRSLINGLLEHHRRNTVFQRGGQLIRLLIALRHSRDISGAGFCFCKFSFAVARPQYRLGRARKK